jgi:DNA-binding NtrC family response regulator
MNRLALDVRKVSEHNLPALIQGESGRGKEMIAVAIHLFEQPAI